MFAKHCFGFFRKRNTIFLKYPFLFCIICEYQGWCQVQLTKYSSTSSTYNKNQVQVLVKYSLSTPSTFRSKNQVKYKYSNVNIYICIYLKLLSVKRHLSGRNTFSAMLKLISIETKDAMIVRYFTANWYRVG